MSQTLEVKVPDIGDYKDIPVIEVLVKVGDTLAAEDPIVTLESDKATMEVPSPAAGTVKEVKVKVGDKVSLGSLLIVFGTQIHPLWQTMLLPLIFLLSAITIGYAVVLFESCLAAAGYRRSIEMHLLTPLAKIMLGVLAVFLLVRFGDLLWRGALGHAFAANLQAFMFWLETACFLSPFVLLRSEFQRRNPARLFIGGALLMLGGVLLRINAFLVGYDTGTGWSYFPSVPELLVTIGMFAIEVLGYIVITRRFPVLPREHAQAAH